MKSTITAAPYQNESLNKIYDMLFCDNLELFRPDAGAEYPLSEIFSAEVSEDRLTQIINDEKIEARIRILACNRLTGLGFTPPDNKLLAVIVEVGLEDGLDVIAAYEDNTARYINHAEKIVFWDTHTEESGRLIGDLFAAGMNVLPNIGLWKEARLAPPTAGNVRLSFIASNGLYFGQGPFEALSKDQMGGPVIHAALQLLMFLTEQ
jgi:hypothetical protein